jgi:hypothetical protein
VGSFDIATGKVHIDARTGYLHIVQPGPLASEDEVLRYAIAIERESQVQQLRRALIDARAEERGVEPPEVRMALWRWLQNTTCLDAVALVMPDQLAETRVNMLAVSQRLLLRAFVDPAIALRWLTRATKSQTLRGMEAEGRARRPSSFPPPITEAGAAAPPEEQVKDDVKDSFVRERSTGPGTGSLSSLPPRRITRH